MVRKVYPRTLGILAGKKWTGKLKVESRVGENLFQVQFDAEDPNGGGERFVYDRSQLTGEQVEAWTGQNPNTWDTTAAALPKPKGRRPAPEATAPSDVCAQRVPTPERTDAQRPAAVKVCLFFVGNVLHWSTKTQQGAPWEAHEPVLVPDEHGVLMRFRGDTAKFIVSMKARSKLRDGVAGWFWDLQVATRSPMLKLLLVPEWTRPGQQNKDVLYDETRAKIGIPAEATGIVILAARARTFEPRLFPHSSSQDDPPECSTKPAYEVLFAGIPFFHANTVAEARSKALRWFNRASMRAVAADMLWDVMRGRYSDPNLASELLAGEVDAIPPGYMHNFALRERRDDGATKPLFGWEE